MSELNFKPLFPLFNVCSQVMARTVWPQGYDLSTNAPDSLRRLKREYAERKRITIYSGGSENTIFDDAGVNQDFRAWHDWCHLAMDADFSPAGEMAAYGCQREHILKRYGDGDTGRALTRVLEAEVVGQSRYYQKYKAYVSDQRGFCLAYMAHADHALSQRW